SHRYETATPNTPRRVTKREHALQRRAVPATGRWSVRLERAGTAAGDPVAHLEPVARTQRLGDLLVGVSRVEDVPFEVATDGDLGQRDVGDLHQRVRRQLRLGDRVVLELELGSDLHQLRPVGTGPRAHAGDGTDSARLTILASVRTKAGSAFGISIRSSCSPSSAAFACASTSRSQRI